jgi:hypothetical protein
VARERNKNCVRLCAETRSDVYNLYSADVIDLKGMDERLNLLPVEMLFAIQVHFFFLRSSSRLVRCVCAVLCSESAYFIFVFEV